MESYTNEPAPVRPPQNAPAWAGQPSPMGSPQAAPAWASNSSALAAPPIKRRTDWPALRFIAKWIKIVAWVELVVGVIFSLVLGASSMGNGGGLAGFALLLGLLLVSGLTFILTYASSEGILVVLAIEKNTRKDE